MVSDNHDNNGFVNQNIIHVHVFSFKIKHQAKKVFPSYVERTVATYWAELPSVENNTA